MLLSAAASGERVLVVDDSAVDAKVLVRALQRSGYAAEALSGAACAGLAAVAALEAAAAAGAPFAACLLDVHMPGGAGGFELVSAVRARPALHDTLLVLVSCVFRDDGAPWRPRCWPCACRTALLRVLPFNHSPCARAT
jgi:CheY-like chemotaxis protein